MLLPILIHRNRSIALGKGRYVVEGPAFFRNRVAHLIQLLMKQVLDGRNSRYVAHKFFHPGASPFYDICRAGHIRRDRRLV
jgi:hypothetical protein